MMRYATLLALLVTMTACQPLRQLPHPAPTGLDNFWQVSGKLALRASAEAPGGRRNQTLQFNWQQRGEDYRLQLRGTLGFGQVLVTREDGQLALHRGGTLVSTADSAEQLLLESTGWALPVSLLRYWATGQPAPDSPYQPIDADDPVQHTGFSQAGWQVSYPGDPAASLPGRPSRMRAEHPHLVLIAAFRGWQPVQPAPAE